MDVTGISVTKAQEILDASIVEGEIDASGNLVLTNGAGAEFNAGVARPAPFEPGRATLVSDDIMAGQTTSAGTFWYTPTFVDALTDVVEYGGVGAQYQKSGNGIKVMEAGVYDISGRVWSDSGYGVGNIVGVRLLPAGLHALDSFSVKPPNLVLGAASSHGFRRTLAANTVVLVQVHATNSGGTSWGDWHGEISVRKSW